jgi:hypothetical protein
MTRTITDEQARKVLKILIEECGHKIIDPRDGEAFVRGIKNETCREWRFMGALGFGGKFRNNGNNGNVPYVDCYPENETPARLDMIARANARLRELFAE